MAGQVELRVVPSVEGLDKGHPALEAAVDEFYDDLRELSGVKIQERDAETAQSGSKGALQHLVLDPDGPAAAWATVKMAKLWLSRDRQRSLSVTIDGPGQEPRTITASGDIVSTEALERAIRDAFGADADHPKSKKKH
jgi:hypothetical protein